MNLLRPAELEAHVRHPSFHSQTSCLLQHLRSRIEGDNLARMGREQERSVTRSTTQVEHSFASIHRAGGQHRSEIRSGRVVGKRGVVGGRGAELIADRLRSVIDAGTPVVLAGDFNALAGWEVMESLEAAGLRFPKVPGATYHLDRGLHLLPAIDHIGHSPGLRGVGGPHVPQIRVDGVWPADHHPVVLDLARP